MPLELLTRQRKLEKLHVYSRRSFCPSSHDTKKKEEEIRKEDAGATAMRPPMIPPGGLEGIFPH